MSCRTCLIIAATALACACSGSASLSAVGQQQLPAKFSAATCARALECCGASPGAPSAATCEAGVTAEYADFFARFSADTNLRYDGVAASACVDGFRALGCGAFASGVLPAACATIFRGALGNGDPCVGPQDCQSGFCANLFAPDGSVHSGACAAAPGAGSACGLIAQPPQEAGVCATGNYAAFASGACTCAPQRAAGASCAEGNDDACATGYCAAGVCAEPSQAATLTDAQCASVFTRLSPSP